MILCILLQDAFVSQFQKSAYPLGCTFILGNRFQKFVWTSFLGKVRREELCVPPSRNETAGLMGLQPSDNGEKPMKIYTRLSVAASFLFHFGFSWISMHGSLFCSVQLPNELSGRNASLASQTSDELAQSRRFMESKLHSIERDFQGHEPAVEMHAFDSFVSKTRQKRSLCICCLHWPISHVFLNPVQSVSRTPTHWNSSGQGFRQTSCHRIWWSPLCSPVPPPLSGIQASGPLLPIISQLPPAFPDTPS